MSRRLLVSTLGLVALIATACGGGDDGSADPATDETESEASDTEESESDGERLTIGVSNLGESFPFPASIGDGIEQRANELGIDVVQFDAQGDANKQSDDVQDLIAQGVDGVLLLPVDSGVAVSLVDQLNEAGIPVVAVASQVGDPSERDLEDVYEGLVALVTQDEIDAGRKAGDLAVELRPDGGQVAIVEGAAGFAEVTTRAVGFEEVLENAGGFEIVARQPGDWVPETAESACQNMLSGNPDIDLFYAQSDDMSVGCAEAVEAAGSSAQVIGIGGSQLGIDAVREGSIEGTVCYKPLDMGELAAQTLYDHLTGAEQYDAAFITYETPPIAQANVDDCDPQW